MKREHANEIANMLNSVDPYRPHINRMFVFFERDFEDLADEDAFNMYCEWLVKFALMCLLERAIEQLALLEFLLARGAEWIEHCC